MIFDYLFTTRRNRSRKKPVFVNAIIMPLVFDKCELL